jgi:hypothetical protein
MRAAQFVAIPRATQRGLVTQCQRYKTTVAKTKLALTMVISIIVISYLRMENPSNLPLRTVFSVILRILEVRHMEMGHEVRVLNCKRAAAGRELVGGCER